MHLRHCINSQLRNLRQKHLAICSNVFWTGFWLLGSLVTVSNMAVSFERYKERPTVVHPRESSPKVDLCDNSQHSSEKLRTRYPMINSSILKMFYGSDVCFNGTLCKPNEPGSRLLDQLEDKDWAMLNEIEVEHFVRNTRPSYKMFMCDIQGHDCKTRWRRRQNFWGHCLEFSSAWFFGRHPNMSTNTRLSFTFSWSETDFTYGLNGDRSGMSVFYAHMLTKHADWEKKLFLTKGLTPIIQLANVHRIQLGEPFSECKKVENITNLYPVFNNENDQIQTKQFDELRSMQRYSEYDCILAHFTGSICKNCNCFPTYLNYTVNNDIVDYQVAGCSAKTACSFEDHIKLRDFDFSPHANCPQECTKYMFRQKSIQYADLNTDLNIDPRHMSIGEKSGKKIATIVINLSGVEVLINEQKEVYSRSQFVSDIGGTAGLIFGLNLLIIVQRLFIISACLSRNISKKLNWY